MMTKKQAKESAIEAGRLKLKEWLSQAEASGIIYYQTAHNSSGGTRYVKLWRVTFNGVIDMLRPGERGLNMDAATTLGGHYEALDIIRKDWCFDYKKRAFVVKGGGFSAERHIVEYLANLAGIKDPQSLVRFENLG